LLKRAFFGLRASFRYAERKIPGEAPGISSIGLGAAAAVAGLAFVLGVAAVGALFISHMEALMNEPYIVHDVGASDILRARRR